MDTYYIIAVLYKKGADLRPKGFDAWSSLPFNPFEWFWRKTKADNFKAKNTWKMWNKGYQGFELFWPTDDMAYAGCTTSDASWTDKDKDGNKFKGSSNRSCLGGHLYHLVGSHYTLNAWF